MAAPDLICAEDSESTPPVVIARTSWPNHSPVLAMSIGIILAGLQAWFTRFTMNPDGVSYLDMGDYFWRGDFRHFVNAYWSPLYAVILGFALRVFRPSPYWEYPLVHLVNFAIFLGALLCFEFWLRTFIKKYPSDMPAWLTRLLTYSLFISGSLAMIGMRVVAPDLLVSALFYLAAALLLRADYTRMGLVLGLAYFAKSAMFPLSFVFFALAGLRDGKKAVRALVIFLTVASLWIVPLSLAKKRFTFGDTGRLAYMAFVDGHPQLVPAGEGLLHPTHGNFEGPGTYPLWYDPSYWHEGEKISFTLIGQSKAIVFSIWTYITLLLNPYQQLGIVICSCLLSLLGAGRRNLKPFRSLLTVAVAPILLYVLLYTEPRYIAASVVILWLCLFASYRGDSVAHRRAALTASALMILSTAVTIFADRPHDEYWQRARLIPPNSRVMIYGDRPWDSLYVARLARAKIVGQPIGAFTKER